MKFRPCATPLITVDPYFSVWSTDDALYGGPTEHWSGKPSNILAGIIVNGAFYAMSAFDRTGKPARSRVFQTSSFVTPTSSVYHFENDFAKVTLTFTTPLLLDKIDIMTRPVSYVSYEVEKKRGVPVTFVFGISAKACVNNKGQCVSFKKTDYSLSCGNTVQNPLAHSGDNVNIDWGYLHLCDTDAVVACFRENEKLEIMPTNAIYDVFDAEPYLTVVKTDGKGVITLAYDEIYPIEYFGNKLSEYYTKSFSSFGDMVKAAKLEYEDIMKLCREFDKKLTDEASALGENYKNIISLAYRQAVAAHKLVLDTEGNILFLSKENDSNGCIGTLDVSYPSIPLFLKYNPELVLGMLRPIIKFAKSDAWKFDFAPHDVGQYPLANGQAYGAQRAIICGEELRFLGELNFASQMPVEESGNMLICLAAVKKYSGGNQVLFDENRELMKKWVSFLVDSGYDPQNQLCTDDFAGHLARNCNLSLKAIIGIAAYADLSGDSSYMDIAKKYAKAWINDAKASHGATRLAFGEDEGYSLKYNMVWDNLLGYNLFPSEVKKNEIELYKKKFNRYGVPLDSRADYTKVDWLMWTTAISDDKEYFSRVCESIVNMINETTDRVPLTDWYYTSTAAYEHFRNRSVVGGLFINLLK
jgi:hypothetical protein